MNRILADSRSDATEDEKEKSKGKRGRSDIQ